MPETAKPSGQGLKLHDWRLSCSLLTFGHPLTNSGLLSHKSFMP